MKTLLSCLALGIASLAFPLETNLKIVSLNDLIRSDFFEMLEKTPKEHQDKYILDQFDSKIIVYFEKGTILPLKLFLNGYFTLINNENNNPQVKLEKDLYVQIKNGCYYFSDDLKSWKDSTNFFTGNISLSIGKENNELPMLKLEGIFNKK